MSYNSVEILAPRSFSAEDLLTNLKLQFTDTSPLNGNLSVNLRKQYGTIRGSFKTAHFGPLRANFDLQTKSFPWNSPICVKKPCGREKLDDGNVKLWQLPLPEEMEMINQELKCMHFAATLMELVYAFIARELKKFSPPPFSIPQMRYVQAA